MPIWVGLLRLTVTVIPTVTDSKVDDIQGDLHTHVGTEFNSACEYLAGRTEAAPEPQLDKAPRLFLPQVECRVWRMLFQHSP